MRVLIIDAEKKVAKLLKSVMEEAGWIVTIAYTGMQGLALAQTVRFDTIVLDIMLPGIDGFEITRRLRRANNYTPVVFLTARDAVTDIVNGLDLGADDYVAKPFSFVELKARIRAVSRRGRVPQSHIFQVADLTLDSSTYEVFRDKQRIPLTKNEYQLLELLLRNAGRVVRREAIIETIWGTREHLRSNTVDALIKLLRHKVDRGREAKLIHTVRGIGYWVRG